MDQGQITEMIKTAGLTSSSGSINWGSIIANLIFGSIGFVAFMYGKKEKNWRVLSISIALMAYTYFVPNVWLIYLIGIGLTVLLFVWRE